VTIDSHLVALDMKTGKQIWKQKFADWREGYYATGAPIVANGVLISGMAGGESTTRGFLDGWDPETGRKLWRRYTIPAPGEPGSETWPANSDAWTRGGGPTWRSGSYDSQLDLVYWGTGNAEPYDPRPREGMDSLFTSSVLAIRRRPVRSSVTINTRQTTCMTWMVRKNTCWPICRLAASRER
jgi:alcohol dehydrogenase (cytochrome c)